MARNPKPRKNDKLDKRIADRQAQLDAYVEKYDKILADREKKYAAEVLPTWQNVGRDLTAGIQELYAKYAGPDGKLDATRLRELERLQFLRQHTAKMALTLQGQDDKITNNVAYTYADSYYFHAFGVQQAVPMVHVITPALTHGTVMGIIANPWLPDGATYSDRIRANTAYLAGKMREAVETATGRGWGINTAARRIKDIAGEGYFNSVRLARTELNRAAGQASSHVFMQHADLLDGKRWNATLDSRTAPKDAENDRKVYDLAYDTPEMPGKPGERIPNHPNCRCKWSPVLASLGPREGERIARGDGDSPTNFGDRIYTKAKDYKGYAKERGIDLDERLRNDDPRRYLRNDERAAAAPGPAPSITAAVTATAAAATWTEAVKQRIAQGVDTEEHAREVGDLVRQEIEKAVQEQAPALRQRVDEIDAEVTKLYNELKDEAAKLQAAVNRGKYDPDELARFNKVLPGRNAALVTKRQDLATARKALSDLRADYTVQKLAELRPMGSSNQHTWVSGSHTKTKDAIQRAQRYYPTEWLEQSHGTNPLYAKVIGRGYYQDNGSLSDFMISGKTDDSLTRVAIHEFGHRFEHIRPEIRRLEKQFYDRRTAGESLQWLGKGYKKAEKSRFDKFLSRYMGKDYGNKDTSYFELFSMGAESIFAGSYKIDTDLDYYNFILGVLATK